MYMHSQRRTQNNCAQMIKCKRQEYTVVLIAGKHYPIIRQDDRELFNSAQPHIIQLLR